MKYLLLCSFVFLLTAAAWSQPNPIEVFSHKMPDTLIALKGPDGKILPDGAPVYVLRMRHGKPGIPQPKTGICEDEMVIAKSQINPNRTYPGEISFTITANEHNETFSPNQAIKHEKVIFRVFATTDTTLPKGTYYTDSPIYEVPVGPGYIDQVKVGEWKQIP